MTEGDKKRLERIPQDVVGGPSIVVTRKAVVGTTFNRKSTTLCKSIVRIDATHLLSYYMCQPMRTGPNTCCDRDSETSSFTYHRNKTGSFEETVMLFFDPTGPDSKIEFCTTRRQNKLVFHCRWILFSPEHFVCSNGLL